MLKIVISLNDTHLEKTINWQSWMRSLLFISPGLFFSLMQVSKASEVQKVPGLLTSWVHALLFLERELKLSLASQKGSKLLIGSPLQHQRELNTCLLKKPFIFTFRSRPVRTDHMPTSHSQFSLCLPSAYFKCIICSGGSSF